MTTKKTYFDLVKEAIIALKDRSGSSAQAIKAYIVKTNPGLKFAQHNLKAALKKGVDGKKLLKLKASFKLSPVEKVAKKPKAPKKKAAKKPKAKKVKKAKAAPKAKKVAAPKAAAPAAAAPKKAAAPKVKKAAAPKAKKAAAPKK